MFASDTSQPFSSLTMAYSIAEEGDEPPVPLPFGPVRDVSFGPGGGGRYRSQFGRPGLVEAISRRHRRLNLDRP